METDDDLRDLAVDVVGYRVGDEFLFKAAQVVVACIFKELGSMVAVLDGERIATEHVEEVGEDLRGAIRNAWGMDRWWAKETTGVKAREDVAGGREEDGEAEGEIIGSVAWAVEDIAGDVEVLTANFHKDFGFKELRLEARYWRRQIEAD